MARFSRLEENLGRSNLYNLNTPDDKNARTETYWVRTALPTSTQICEHVPHEQDFIQVQVLQHIGIVLLETNDHPLVALGKLAADQPAIPSANSCLIPERVESFTEDCPPQLVSMYLPASDVIYLEETGEWRFGAKDDCPFPSARPYISCI